MAEFFGGFTYFGAALCIVVYMAGFWICKKSGSPVFNPFLTALVLLMLSLCVLDIEYEAFTAQAQPISYLLTPATVCLAIPLYEQIELLKKNARAVFGGIAAGVLTSLVCVFVMAKLFGIDHAAYVSLLPKSITMAIGMDISEMLGGYVAVTIAAITITGIIGNIFAAVICRMWGVREPVARGVAIGCASHAMGTAKAMEIGDVEGAMSGLSIAVAGLLTVVGAPFFAGLIV